MPSLLNDSSSPSKKPRSPLLIFAAIGVALFIGAFTWLAVTDVPVQQSEIRQTISNDRFFNTGR